MPSADLQSFFVFDTIKGLSITATAAEPALKHFDGRLASYRPPAGNLPFTWLKGSQSVLGVRQDTINPSGFAVGPLRPFLFSNTGTLRQLPELKNEAGPLDELYWAGQTGSAVAAFGTRGSYYRPEHEDDRPTIALVDARAGRVMHEIEIGAIKGLNQNNRIGAVSSVVDKRGKIHALINFSPDGWVLWVEGEPPHIVPVGAKTWRTSFALSPDGRSVLIMKNLSATGVICEHNPRCPAPTASTGVVAELREVSSGKLIWSIDGTATTFSNSDLPAISPNGRYALISMPAGKHGPTTALISMKSGKVLQEIPDPWTSECLVGFSQDSRTAWISGGSRLVTYVLQN